MFLFYRRIAYSQFSRARSIPSRDLATVEAIVEAIDVDVFLGTKASCFDLARIGKRTFVVDSLSLAKTLSTYHWSRRKAN